MVAAGDVHRGDVFLISLDPTRGDEIQRTILRRIEILGSGRDSSHVGAIPRGRGMVALGMGRHSGLPLPSVRLPDNFCAIFNKWQYSSLAQNSV